MTTTATALRIATALRTHGPRSGLNLTERQIVIAARIAAAAAVQPRPVDPPEFQPASESRRGPGRQRRGLGKDDMVLLEGIAQGLGNEALGQRLGWTEAKVKGRLKTLFALLGANGRARAVAAGFERGLLPVRPVAPKKATGGVSGGLGGVSRPSGGTGPRGAAVDPTVGVRVAGVAA